MRSRLGIRGTQEPRKEQNSVSSGYAKRQFLMSTSPELQGFQTSVLNQKVAVYRAQESRSASATLDRRSKKVPYRCERHRYLLVVPGLENLSHDSITPIMDGNWSVYWALRQQCSVPRASQAELHGSYVSRRKTLKDVVKFHF